MQTDHAFSQYQKIISHIGDATVTFLYTEASQNLSSVSRENTPLHLHWGAEIHFIFSGNYLFMTDEETKILSDGTICILPSKYIHALKADSEACKSFSFIMDIEPASKGQRPKEDGEYAHYQKLFENLTKAIILQDAEIFSYMNAFLRALHTHHFESAYLAETLLRLIFLSVSEKIHSDILPSPKGRTAKDDVDSDLETMIMTNYHKNLSVDEVADFFGLSKTYISKKIKKKYNLTYAELLQKLKMAHAKREITETTLPITEIAENVGYQSYNGFRIAFKKYFGTSPEQMRKETFSQ